MNSETQALKLCPFCGKHNTLTLTSSQELAAQDSKYDDEVWEHSDSWAVMCDAHRPGGPGGCGASGGFFATDAEAVAAWNKRAECGHKADEIERFRQGYERYETARLMSPAQWGDAWRLNLKTGKGFDEIIDNLRCFLRPIDKSKGKA